jgi:hypothetical protein
MAKARQQAKRKSEWRQQRTPQPKEPDIPIIGSSCTWRDTELDHFKVTVERDVDVRKMIPERFFNFDHLEDYEECNFVSFDSADIQARQSFVLCPRMI